MTLENLEIFGKGKLIEAHSNESTKIEIKGCTLAVQGQIGEVNHNVSVAIINSQIDWYQGNKGITIKDGNLTLINNEVHSSSPLNSEFPFVENIGGSLAIRNNSFEFLSMSKPVVETTLLANLQIEIASNKFKMEESSS